VSAIARRLPGRPAPQLGAQVVAGVLIAAATAALTWFIVGHSTQAGAAALVAALGAAWFATTRRIELALALLMLYLGLLDGYLKLSTGSNLVTFARDILLYAIVVGQLVRATVTRRPLPLPPLSGWVIAFVVIVFAQMLNPADGSLYHSLSGVRQHLEFVPLFFLAYAYVRTPRALRIFVVLLLVIAAANAAANFVEFHLTPAQLATWGPGYAARINGTGQFQFSGRVFFDSAGNTHVRPFGLLSEAGAGGIAAAFAVGGVLWLARRFTRLRSLLLALGMAIAVTVALVTSEGRGAILCGFAVAIGYAMLTAKARGRMASMAGLALVGVVAAIVVGAVISAAGTSAFRYQGLSTSGIAQTTANARGTSFEQIIPNLIHYPLGGGLGVGGPAAGISGAPVLASTVDTENEISFATLETGIPGMITLIGFTALVFILGVKRCANEPDPETRYLLAAIIAPIAGMLALYLISAASPTTPSGPYLWACGGIVSYWLVTRPAERAAAAAARPAAVAALSPGAPRSPVSPKRAIALR
jgi:hypothetical protein